MIQNWDPEPQRACARPKGDAELALNPIFMTSDDCDDDDGDSDDDDDDDNGFFFTKSSSIPGT